MRKILFRGKRVDNGEWVSGYFARFAHGEIPVILEDTESELKDYKVIPDTVGQFTGLLDKNGKEIYEGDVVTFDNNLQGISKVMFAEGCYMVVAKNYATALTFRLANRTFVAGNIHDKPELLNNIK